MPDEPIDEPKVSVPPDVAISTLAGTRIRVESAEWHLRRIVKIGDRLSARRAGFDEMAAGNDEATISACRKVIEDPAIQSALLTVEKARQALAELAKWKERGDG